MSTKVNKYRILQVTPFAMLSCIVANTWFIFISTDYEATWGHYLLLAFILINAVFYFKNWKLAVLLTGILLLGCTFYLLPPFMQVESAFIHIGPVPIPWIEYWSFLIFLIYFIINFNYLIELYLDFQEHRKEAKNK